LTAIDGDKKMIRGVVQGMWIHRRKLNRLRSVGTKTFFLHRQRSDVLYLAGHHVIPRNFGSPRAVYDVRVQRIGCGVSVLDDACWVPIAECNFAIIAAR